MGADFIALTGKSSQQCPIEPISREFRRRGKVVILGGPFASLCPETARDYCDILIRGEIEEIGDELFSDLADSSWKPEYVGTRPSLELTPPPRWDLYPNDRALVGAVQTSRGCPFECDFCDVIQYLGRNQRHKPVASVLRELEFITAAALPIVTLGALVAPEGTPLRQRMLEEGRLLEDGSQVAATPWSTNFIPRRMSRQELLEGIRWLRRELYESAGIS